MSIINGIDTATAEEIVKTVKENSEYGKTMWQASTVWKGGCKSETNIRDFKVTIDEPMELGGENSAPNPVEMVLSALNGCLVVGYALNAAMLGIEIKKLEIYSEGDIDLPGFFGLESDVLPGYTNIRTKVVIKSDATMEQLEEVHQRVLKTSPVGITLSKDVKLDIELVKRRVI